MPLGPLQTNAYLIYDETTRKAVIIDPGAEPKKVIETLEKQQLKLEKILLTHGHFDHIGAVEVLKQETQAKVIAHKNAPKYLENPSYNLSQMFMGGVVTTQADDYVEDGDEIRIDGSNLCFKVIAIPGHTLDGMAFYDEKNKEVYVGDSLFKGSIGRTDFVGGDLNTLLKGIKNKLFTLPDETIVYPGHGESTTIGYEKSTNLAIR